jgi:hypothetical protein
MRDGWEREKVGKKGVDSAHTKLHAGKNRKRKKGVGSAPLVITIISPTFTLLISRLSTFDYMLL